MRLKIAEFEKLAAQKGYSDGCYLWVGLGGGSLAYELIKNGTCRLGYEMAKTIFNTFGQAVTAKIIDFENDSIEGFKSKYVCVNDKLSGETDDEEIKEYINENDKELIYLLAHAEPREKIFPDWYFTWKHYSLRCWKFMQWKRRNRKTWHQILDEVGLSKKIFKKKLRSRNKWTMIDLICLKDLMGTKDLFETVYFKTKEQREEMRNLVFGGGKCE